MPAEYPNISKTNLSSRCLDSKNTQVASPNEAGEQIQVTDPNWGHPVSGIDSKNHLEGHSRWKTWVQFLSTLVQLPKKQDTVAF